MAAALTFGGGALLGVASSLHCVGMCGGIAMLLGLPAPDDRPAHLLLGHLTLHGGRALSYMVLGGLAGALGAAAFGLVAVPQAHLLLRWAAAMTLVWVGLSTLGLVPSPAVIGHAMLPRLRLPHGGSPASVTGRMLAGIGWGFMPCGMVYGALLYAAFAGSALGGMLVMAGFAMGTVPALLLVQSGAGPLAKLARKREARVITGIAILAVALVSLLPGEGGILAACGDITALR